VANPLIELLEGSARASYGFLEAAAASPSSANQILRDLADAGFSIRRQTGLDIIATLRGSLNAARVARLAPPNTVIPDTLLPPSPHPIAKQYSFRVKVNNPETDIPGFLNIASDVPLSINQIFSVATSYLTAGDSPTLQGIQNAAPDLTLDRGLRNPFTMPQGQQDAIVSQLVSDTAPEFVDNLPAGTTGTGPEGFGHGF
jgi:hypothetical protein